MKNASKTYEDIQPLIENRQYHEAIEALETFLREHEDFAQGYHDLGSLYLNVGNKEKAASNYQKATARAPENNAFLRDLGDFYYVEMQDYDKGLEYYRKIIKNGAEDAEIYFIAGNLSLVAHKLEDAVTYYEKVLDIEPRHMEAFDYLEKVNAHLNSQHTDSEEDSAEALYKKAVDMGAEGKDTSAVTTLKKVIAINPDHAMAHNDLGVYFYRLGDEEKSLAHYRIAVRLDPLNTIFRKNLADFLCFVKGDVEEALKLYVELLQEDPEDVEVLMAVGRVNQAIGRASDSELFYERVLDIEPWNLDAGEILEGLKVNSQRNAALQ